MAIKDLSDDNISARHLLSKEFDEIFDQGIVSPDQSQSQ